MRKITLVLFCLLLALTTVAAQTMPLDTVEAQLQAIKINAQGVLDRNTTLSRKSRLPLWVTDAEVRTLMAVNVALEAVEQARIRTAPISGGLVPDYLAASCSRADVFYLLDTQIGTQTGKIGKIPGCTGTEGEWTTEIEWTAPANTTIIGAGSLTTDGGGNATILIDRVNSGAAMLNITTSATGKFRMAGITFKGGSVASEQYKNEGVVRVLGNTSQMRLDHITVDTRTYVNVPSSNALKMRGCVSGVIDSSIFEANNAFVAHRDGCGAGQGDASWAEATGFGTANFVFFEDNTLNPLNQYASINDCYHGGKWVVRYNVSNGASVQTHPTGGSNRARGCRATEFYGNTLNANSYGSQFNAFFLSSGPSMFWGNVAAASSYSNFVTLHSMRRNNGTYTQAATPNGWGYCGTSFNGTGSNWDGNTNASTGYPCLDQPGRGISDLLVNDFPTAQNTDTSSISWPDQALEPVYGWLNTWVKWEGGNFMAVYEADAMFENQDFYTDANNTTGAAITFNGSVGVGSGLRSARPAAGSSTNGVAYWSTDQGGNWNTKAGNVAANDGCLDKMVAGAWVDCFYTPYAYPHPGRQ